MNAENETVFHQIGQLLRPNPDPGDTPMVTTSTHKYLRVKDGMIVEVGDEASLNLDDERTKTTQLIDLNGAAVLPGFCDSHTHLLYAGDRVDEMERRCRGESYEEIAAAGGGIAFSQHQFVRAADEEILLNARRWVQAMRARGTTTIEVKSGYGLSPTQELRQVRLIQKLADIYLDTIIGTVLAHKIPLDWSGNRQSFVDMFCAEVLPQAAELPAIKFCDVFVENGAFSIAEARQICQRAQDHGLDIKLHVDQLSAGGGAALAAEMRAVSADHLEYANDDDLKKMRDAGTVATLLPGCRLFLGQGPWPDGRRLRDLGCTTAIATDFNPGSCHILDLGMIGAFAATQCGMHFDEVMWGITRGGALALGQKSAGILEKNNPADMVVLNAPDWRQVFYCPGFAPISAVYKGGQKVFSL